MAVSLVMRISGLLVVGAVAVAVAAFTGDGSGTPDSRGGGSSVLTAGPPSDGTSGSPTPRQSPAGEASGTVRLGRTPNSTTPTAGPSTSPTPSPSNRLLASPVWLPPGPASPDADSVPDPSSVYDRLRDPGRCRAALKLIPTVSADPEWRLLRGLATACLAVQGRGGSWATAAKEYAAVAGKTDTCKGRAAYAVLGGLLDFHRRHPGATAQLKATSGGAPACTYQLTGVDTGGDGKAQPGDTVAIELRGTFFDHTELLRFGSVFIGGQQLAGPPVLRSQTADTLTLSAVVPSLAVLNDTLSGPAAASRGAGLYRCAAPPRGATSHNGAADDVRPTTAPPAERTVDVIVRYGNTEARLQDAFTVPAPAAAPSPTRSAPSGTPQGMLPLGPLTADPPGP